MIDALSRQQTVDNFARQGGRIDALIEGLAGAVLYMSELLVGMVHDMGENDRQKCLKKLADVKAKLSEMRAPDEY